MHPLSHLLIGVIFSFFIFQFFPEIGLLGFATIFLSTVFIDGDHYLYYIYRKKDLSLIKAYNWYMENSRKFKKFSKKERRNLYSGFYMLHGIEILLILLVSGFYLSKFFFFVFLGFSLHLFLDLLVEVIYSCRIDKISVIYNAIKFKRLKHIEDV